MKKEKEIYERIQRLIYYMIPEKWESIKLYASTRENLKGKKGELFFYYKPKKILPTSYINCYEVPDIFDIEEDEYLKLISKLYNTILILNDYHAKYLGINWTNITISIDKSKFKIEILENDLSKSEFDSYERHIVWRYKNLKIEPISKEEKYIIKKFFMSKEAKQPKEVFISPLINQKVKNIVDYEKVLTVEEALAQKEEERLEEEYYKLKEIKRQERLRKKEERERKSGINNIYENKDSYNIMGNNIINENNVNSNSKYLKKINNKENGKLEIIQKMIAEFIENIRDRQYSNQIKKINNLHSEIMSNSIDTKEQKRQIEKKKKRTQEINPKHKINYTEEKYDLFN